MDRALPSEIGSADMMQKTQVDVVVFCIIRI
jgi:hypothetical protein